MASSAYGRGDYDEGPYGFISTTLRGTLDVSPVFAPVERVSFLVPLSGGFGIQPVLSGGFSRILLTTATIHVTFSLSGSPYIGELWVPIPEANSPWN